MNICAHCGTEIPERRLRYRNRFGPTRYCSNKCNRAATRKRKTEARRLAAV